MLIFELPDYASPAAHQLRERLWRSRLTTYRMPYAREAMRYLYREVLGQGEFQRIQACKESVNTYSGAKWQ